MEVMILSSYFNLNVIHVIYAVAYRHVKCTASNTWAYLSYLDNKTGLQPMQC